MSASTNAKVERVEYKEGSIKWELDRLDDRTNRLLETVRVLEDSLAPLRVEPDVVASDPSMATDTVPMRCDLANYLDTYNYRTKLATDKIQALLEELSIG